MQLFQAFEKESGRAGQHVSWLDVAELSWDGPEIWREHQKYVREMIAPKIKLTSAVARDRSLQDAFSSAINPLAGNCRI